MAEAARKNTEPAAPLLAVAPAPHLATGRTTRRVMIDVLIALAPVFAVGCWVFGWRAVAQVGICAAACVFFEALWQLLRRREQTVGDFSAAVTGVILGLSIPWTAPWYVGVVGSGVAILIVKMLFGGLGSNIFNPAMGGRAFLQACFAGQMTTYTFDKVGPPGAIAQAIGPGGVEVITQATPLAAAANETVFALKHLAIGTVNGSVGETSAIACIIGGLYLIMRRSASWRISLGMIASAAVVAMLVDLQTTWAVVANFGRAVGLGAVGQVGPMQAAWAQLAEVVRTNWTFLHHLCGGALLFGAFFIVTDPATSPISRRGRWIFAIGAGVLVMLIRLFANVPEGVMYAVLVMNMTVPLIGRLTVPRPVGGPTPLPKPA